MKESRLIGPDRANCELVGAGEKGWWNELSGGPPKWARGPRALPGSFCGRLPWSSEGAGHARGFGQDARNDRLEAGATQGTAAREPSWRPGESSRAGATLRHQQRPMNMKESRLIGPNRFFP